MSNSQSNASALLNDCSQDNISFADNFDGLFTSQLAVYLRDTGKCSMGVIDDTDPVFVAKFMNLKSLLKQKYLAQVRSESKCNTLAEAFKKTNHLPNITSFFEHNDRQINEWVLDNIFDSNIPHLGSQTDAGVAVTLYQEFIQIHDMLIPKLTLPRHDKMQIMLRSIAISKLLLSQKISQLGLPNRFVAMANPRVKAHFRDLVTFPKFRQHQINEIPEARAYQDEILDSFRKDLKPVKQSNTMLIVTSVAAGALLTSVLYLMSRKKEVDTHLKGTAVFEGEPRLDLEEDTLIDFPMRRQPSGSLKYSRPPTSDLEALEFQSDPQHYAQTNLKPVQ